MSKKLKLKCPECGCETGEEVMKARTYSPIVEIDEEGQVEYGNTETEYEDIDRYQCEECNTLIKHKTGYKIGNLEQLAE